MAAPRPNYLLLGFILMSLLLHLVLVLHLAGVYESRTISYIELSMQQLSSPKRDIPRPRIRQKPPVVSQVKTVQVKKFHLPTIQMEKMEDHKIDPSHVKIDLPQQPDSLNISGFSVAGLNLPAPAENTAPFDASIEFTSAKEYFEMVQLRILRYRKYPESAKSSHIEGRVKVQFVLSGDGTLTDVKILKSSHHGILDEAAIDAIQDASPFPRPPGFIFKTPVTLRIDILFELV